MLNNPDKGLTFFHLTNQKPFMLGAAENMAINNSFGGAQSGIEIWSVSVEMKFKGTQRRRRIELVGLELISALTKSGLVRNKSIIELYLMAFSDVPWTISGLSSAAQIDRAIIRDYFKRGLASGEYLQEDGGYVLSPEGWAICMRRVRHWQRFIHPDVRKFLYRFFKAFGGKEPLRQYFMFILSLDRLARIVKLEFSYIAGLKVIEWEAGPEGVPIKQAAERTGFSYSVMHKQYTKMIEKHYIKRLKTGLVLTSAGKRHSYRIFLSSWRAVTLKEWITAVKMMTPGYRALLGTSGTKISPRRMKQKQITAFRPN